MSQSGDQISERVLNVVKEVLRIGDDQITPEARFREELGADSLDIVSLLMAFEEEFEESISDEEAKELTTIGAAIEFICAKTAAVEV